MHRKLVARVWVGLLVLTAVGAVTLSGKTSDNFELSGVESTQAFDLIKERSPAGEHRRRDGPGGLQGPRRADS